jgi:hypothetical protein
MFHECLHYEKWETASNSDAIFMCGNFRERRRETWIRSAKNNSHYADARPSIADGEAVGLETIAQKLCENYEFMLAPEVESADAGAKSKSVANCHEVANCHLPSVSKSGAIDRNACGLTQR